MKRLFYPAILLLILFEIANVYFIMPVPGSQDMESLGLAYFLYTKRWIIRGALILLGLAGLGAAWKRSKWLFFLLLILAGVVGYMTNFKMAADTMFYQPQRLVMAPAEASSVDMERIVLGIQVNGQARAYPVQYIGYHHQVRDTIGGKHIMATYCTVCRTGRVFEPVVDGRVETFRLVGMDHFNAMFEDAATGSWWRQVNGEAVAGRMKGKVLPEVFSIQTSLHEWLKLHPGSLIMQPDTAFVHAYAAMDNYERGNLAGSLTRYDTASWQDKSWIAGVAVEGHSKAYDWNEVKRQRVINDMVGVFPVAIVVTSDHKSLFGFFRSADAQELSISHDTLSDGRIRYTLSGLPIDTIASPLRPLQVYQEYWHSWRTFHPDTKF